MAGWFRYDPPIRAWLDGFLDVWLAQDKRGEAERRGGLNIGQGSPPRPSPLASRERGLALARGAGEGAMENAAPTPHPAFG
jgi:hypothetical protein